MTAGDPQKAFSIVIGNAIAEMPKIVDLVEAFGAHHSLPQQTINALNICLDELINNTISYGYDDSDKHDIAVELGFIDGVLTAQVRDDGRPFDPRGAAPALTDGSAQSRPIGGLGLHFVKTLMDEIKYSRIGATNLVTIEKRIQVNQ
jgi:anti-sigma regulatory factor (Ser/Thr protein kinase)